MHAGTRGAFDAVRKVKSRQGGNLGPGRAKTCRLLHLFSPLSTGEMQPALPTEAEKPVHRRGKSNTKLHYTIFLKPFLYRFIIFSIDPFLWTRNSFKEGQMLRLTQTKKRSDSTFFPIHPPMRFDTLINSNYFRRVAII